MLAVASRGRHPSLAGVDREAFVRGTFQQRAAAAHVERLAVAGMPLVTLGGPAFAVQTLGDAAVRSSSDVDLFVRRRDLPRVRAVLVAAGMTDTVPYPVWYEERWHDHAAFTGAAGQDQALRPPGRARLRRDRPAQRVRRARRSPACPSRPPALTPRGRPSATARRRPRC